MKEQTTEKTINQLIDINDFLIKQIDNMKKVIEYQNNEAEYLFDTIENIRTFSAMNNDQKTTELLNIRENMRLAEQIAGLVPSEPDDFEDMAGDQ